MRAGLVHEPPRVGLSDRAASPGRRDRGPGSAGHADSARVDLIPETPGAVRVTFQPAEWPNVNIAAPRDQAWNSHGFLLLAVRNPEQHEIEFGIRIDDDVAADGSTHCRTALTKLKPGESRPPAPSTARHTSSGRAESDRIPRHAPRQKRS